MGITVKGNHTGFMRQITGKQVRRKADGTWSTPEAEEVAVTQYDTTYIRRRQGKMEQ